MFVSCLRRWKKMWSCLRKCLLITLMICKLERLWGNTSKTKDTFFPGTFFDSMMALGKRPQAFVCAKSDFNLVPMIDVAFYFKCLWKYPTTVLCGPLSNETHSRTPLIAIRSLASTQCSPWSVSSQAVSIWWARGRNSSRSGSHLWKWVLGSFFSTTEGLYLQGSCVGAVSLILSQSISSGPHELPLESSSRISTPEVGVKGSGASVQGSARGLTFDLSSAN